VVGRTPQTDSLAAQAAARVLSETAPNTIAAAVRAASAFESGEGSRLDALAAEMALRLLVQDVVRAHQRLPGPTGLGTEDYEVVDASDREATVRAPMAFCPESALIVHGPIMVGRVCAILQRLWGGTIRPVGLRRVKFHKPVRNDLAFSLWRGEGEAPDRGSDVVVSGTLLGSAGDDVGFAAVETESPVAKWIDNREVTGLTRIEPSNDDRNRHTLSLTLRPQSEIDELFPRSLPEAVQILLEAMSRTAVLTRNADGRGILLGGIRSMRWPADIADRIRTGISLSCLAKPFPRSSPGSIWRPLLITFEGCAPVNGLAARLDFAEAHTTMTAIFRHDGR
jgi:hypothetical protein